MLKDPGKLEQIDEPDPDGNTLLIEACQEGNMDLVCLLLHNGADPYVQNKAHESALVAADRRGFEDIASILREYMALTLE